VAIHLVQVQLRHGLEQPLGFGIRKERLRIPLVLQGGGFGGRRGHLADGLPHSLEAIQLAKGPQQVHFQSKNPEQKYTRRDDPEISDGRAGGVIQH